MCFCCLLRYKSSLVLTQQNGEICDWSDRSVGKCTYRRKFWKDTDGGEGCKAWLLHLNLLFSKLEISKLAKWYLTTCLMRARSMPTQSYALVAWAYSSGLSMRHPIPMPLHDVTSWLATACAQTRYSDLSWWPGLWLANQRTILYYLSITVWYPWYLSTYMHNTIVYLIIASQNNHLIGQKQRLLSRTFPTGADWCWGGDLGGCVWGGGASGIVRSALEWQES